MSAVANVTRTKSITHSPNHERWRREFRDPYRGRIPLCLDRGLVLNELDHNSTLLQTSFLDSLFELSN